MSTHLGWYEIALRLALTIAAGALIGANRGEHGHAAGLRTVMLVCLAASISMIQANLLLGTVGKSPDSFIVLDLMRLPLGILSGMGFIGGGAILRRDNMIQGVTTAATLWFVTVIGLCFGGGQLGLGIAAVLICSIVLSGMKQIEQHCKRERRGALALICRANEDTEREIIDNASSAGFALTPTALACSAHGQHRKLSFDVKWRARPTDSATPSFLAELARRPDVVKVEWEVKLA
jgi:putative Mg2+ transporter-C (MgtC) family protein